MQSFWEKFCYFYLFQYLSRAHHDALGAPSVPAGLLIGYLADCFAVPVTYPIDGTLNRSIKQDRPIGEVVGEIVEGARGDGGEVRWGVVLGSLYRGVFARLATALDVGAALCQALRCASRDGAPAAKVAQGALRGSERTCDCRPRDAWVPAVCCLGDLADRRVLVAVVLAPPAGLRECVRRTFDVVVADVPIVWLLHAAVGVLLWCAPSPHLLRAAAACATLLRRAAASRAASGGEASAACDDVGPLK